MNTVSLDLSGTTETSASPMKSPEEKKEKRRRRGIRDDPLLLAVTICTLESMKWWD